MASDQITTARGLVPALIKKAIDSMTGDGRCMGHFRVTFQVPSVPNRATVDDGENDGVTTGRSCLRYSSPSFAPPLCALAVQFIALRPLSVGDTVSGGRPIISTVNVRAQEEGTPNRAWCMVKHDGNGILLRVCRPAWHYRCGPASLPAVLHKQC